MNGKELAALGLAELVDWKPLPMFDRPKRATQERADMKRQTPRRDFLLGKLAGGGPEGGRSDNTPPPSRSAEGSYLLHITRAAMACEFEICLPAPRYAGHTEVALEALDLVEQLESQMSVFRQSSEICRINRTAAQRAVEVEPRLFKVLEAAMELYRQTEGAYDITAGPLWEVWGFARRAGAIPSPEQLAEARSRVGGHLVELDPERETIRFLRPGVQLSLGSVGKGYAVDRCGEQLRIGGVCDFLIHGGNSSVLARGSRDAVEGDRSSLADTTTGTVPGEAAGHRGEGWTVGIRDPLHPERRLGELRLCDRALGTSGAQFQSFRHRGRRYGHILDPRTGWPAEGVLSVTVLAPTAARADALSTAFYVMGPRAAVAWCREHPEIAAVVVLSGPGWRRTRNPHGRAERRRLESAVVTVRPPHRRPA